MAAHGSLFDDAGSRKSFLLGQGSRVCGMAMKDMDQVALMRAR